MAEGSESPSPSKVSRGHHGGLKSAPTIALLVTTEIIKWLVILGAVYLGIWQYCDITDPDEGTVSQGNGNSTPDSYAKCSFGEGQTIGQFWGSVTGILLGISVLLYLPWRIIATRLRFKYYIFRDDRW